MYVNQDRMTFYYKVVNSDGSISEVFRVGIQKDQQPKLEILI
jgi:hypothetical protein